MTSKKENPITILVDLHNTLLNKEDKPNKSILDLMKGYKRCGYAIVLITADLEFNPEKTKNILDENSITKALYDECWYPLKEDNFNKNQDDAQIKGFIFNSYIKDSYNVKILIDNNKNVCKFFNKELGINTLRFKEAN